MESPNDGENRRRNGATVGICVSPNTVAKLLKMLNFHLRLNHKKLSSGSGKTHDQQFGYIKEQRQRFAQAGLPIISVDAK